MWCGHSLSRLWNTVFKEYMESTNFKQSRGDSCIFVRSEGTDLTIITKTLEMMRRIKDILEIRFKMKDLTIAWGLLLNMMKSTRSSIFTLSDEKHPWIFKYITNIVTNSTINL